MTDKRTLDLARQWAADIDAAADYAEDMEEK